MGVDRHVSCRLQDLQENFAGHKCRCRTVTSNPPQENSQLWCASKGEKNQTKSPFFHFYPRVRSNVQNEFRWFLPPLRAITQQAEGDREKERGSLRDSRSRGSLLINARPPWPIRWQKKPRIKVSAERRTRFYERRTVAVGRTARISLIVRGRSAK